MRRRDGGGTAAVERFWAALERDPDAPPPDGLDPELAALVRRLVRDVGRVEPDPAFIERLQQRLDTRAHELAASRTDEEPARRHRRVPGRLGILAAVLLLLAIIAASSGAYAAWQLLAIRTPQVLDVPPPAGPNDLRLLGQALGDRLDGRGGPARYAFIVQNPRTDAAVRDSRYRLTAYGRGRGVVAEDEGTIPLILPGQTLGISDTVDLPPGITIDIVTVDVQTGEPADPPDQPPLATANVAWADKGPTVTGVVRNPSDRPVGAVRVSALAYGEEFLVGGGFIVVDTIPAGGSVEVRVPVSFGHRWPVRAELYAVPDMPAD